MDTIYIVALVFLIASWVLAIINLTKGGQPSPLDCAVWAIAVLAVFRGLNLS